MYNEGVAVMSSNITNSSSNSSLDIINSSDEQFDEKFPEILKKVKLKKLQELEPSIDEINKVYSIIFKYIKENKRKIYGGYALNKLLIDKDKNLALYDETDIPDIDFYSPDPLSDLANLCELLQEGGLNSVEGREAQHKETYSIFVNYQLYCDISYMSNNIFSHVRFLKMDDFHVVHPWFMTIDYFRMFTDPLISYWRLEKHFHRYKTLEKMYPLPLIKEPVEMIKYNNTGINKAINTLFDYLSENDGLIFTGFYAYNYYLHISEYNKNNNNYKYISLPYLEVYSDDYIKDGIELIDFIKNLPKEISSKLSHKEYYPFFQFYGYNVVIYYNDGKEDIPILYMYTTNKKCIPLKKVNLIKFNNLDIMNPTINKKKNINIGSFEFNILHALIILVKVRVDEDNEWNDILYKYINGIVAFRKYYLNKHNITIYDDSIFQGLVTDCIGKTISPEIERKIIIKERKKKGKPLVFRYEPGVSKKPDNYIFLNSSGNIIKNENNMKLNKKNINDKIEDEIEDNIEDNI